MTDIVERLREEAEWYFNAAWIRQDGGNDYRLSGRLADEAAAEIERLREALREFVWLWPRPYPSAPEDMMYQQACIDKARTALGEKE